MLVGDQHPNMCIINQRESIEYDQMRAYQLFECERPYYVAIKAVFALNEFQSEVHISFSLKY